MRNLCGWCGSCGYGFLVFGTATAQGRCLGEKRTGIARQKTKMFPSRKELSCCIANNARRHSIGPRAGLFMNWVSAKLVARLENVMSNPFNGNPHSTGFLYLGHARHDPTRRGTGYGPLLVSGLALFIIRAYQTCARVWKNFTTKFLGIQAEVREQKPAVVARGARPLQKTKHMFIQAVP